MQKRLTKITLFIFLLLITACERPDPQVTVLSTRVPLAHVPTPPVTPMADNTLPTPARATAESTTSPTPLPTYNGTPTPNPTRPGSTTTGSLYHTVQAGETLGLIAQRYAVTIAALQEANGLAGDLVYAGQTLTIPNQVTAVSPSFKIIPDSELVYSPAAAAFDVKRWLAPYDGYLATYQEVVEGQTLTGAEIIQLIADRFSLNPRLLLAVLEHQAGWITQSSPAETVYPLGLVQANSEGLYWQLYWAADQLNKGFYGRSEGGLDSFLVGENQRLTFAPDINDGTAGVQLYLGARSAITYAQWQQDVGPDGLFATYTRLFGNPFAYTVDPLWPDDLTQPVLQLPWPAGETWYYTSGPHGGWGAGSAWAALDFVPPGEEDGCYPSDAWVTAMSDGLVVRSSFGAVVVDLDGDGFAGTGWVLTYMHLENRDRVAEGTWVQTGDPLGHPSCEGGFSNGTHVHVSRSYNGRWVSADGRIPFVMSGWTAQGAGQEYDGYLIRGDIVKEAYAAERAELNAILHEQ